MTTLHRDGGHAFHDSVFCFPRETFLPLSQVKNVLPIH